MTGGFSDLCQEYRIRSVEALDALDGKRVLVRVDFNVPMDSTGKILGTVRVTAALQTIQFLRERGAKVILITHLGQPRAVQNGERPSVSCLLPLLRQLLDIPMYFVAEKVGVQEINAIPDDVLILENIRFQQGEELNDPDFARYLASLADIYVNDAFSCSHRKHASIVTVPRLIPGYAGLGLLKELQQLEENLGKFFKGDRDSSHIMAIIGGKKTSTKFPLLLALAHKVDILAVVGSMANAFLHALGYDVGQSLYEEDIVEQVREFIFMHNAKMHIVLPKDIMYLEPLAEGQERCGLVDVGPNLILPKSAKILDIGPNAVQEIYSNLLAVSAVIWNGPAGCYEDQRFSASTHTIGRYIAKLIQSKQLASVVGGGDTLAALSAAGFLNSMSCVSTAGGAFLAWLENQFLPGIKALQYD
ncbi:Phosphoglycerate kinase [Alphaproteobacteria bacterium]